MWIHIKNSTLINLDNVARFYLQEDPDICYVMATVAGEGELCVMEGSLHDCATYIKDLRNWMTYNGHKIYSGKMGSWAGTAQVDRR